MKRWLVTDRSGASAAEFALVLPILLILLLGIIDAGRWLWTYNRAEKATQMGARFAAVAAPVANQVSASFNGVTCGGVTLTQGDLIPASCFTKVTCTSNGTTATCTPASGTAVNAAFNKIVQRMQVFMPELTAAKVSIEYSPSGLGYAGNPSGPDVSPLITVKTRDLTFSPIAFKTFGQLSINMPTFSSSVTSEDLTGADSN